MAIDIFLIAAVLIPGAIWLIRFSGDPTKSKRGSFEKVAKPPTRTRRDELREARARIERQMEILRTPVGGPSYQNAPPSMSAELAELQEVLDGINRELE